MKLMKLLLLLSCFLFVSAVSGQAGEAPVHRLQAKEFAQLPDGVMFPEGITANADRQIIVGTFNFSGNNTLLRYDRKGKLLAMKDFGDSLLLGLAYNPLDNNIYICNFGNPYLAIMPEIQRIQADFDSSSLVETVAAVPLIGPPGDRLVGNADGSQDTIIFQAQFPAPNALAFADNGDLYFSDSFQGAIFIIEDPTPCSGGCTASTVIHHPLLATTGAPPFGANGLVLDETQSQLYVANTGDDRVLKVDLTIPDISVFSESINGADGLAVDGKGRLLVAANQADEIVVLNKAGKVVAKYGESASLQNPSTGKGLLFPASMVRIGKRLYVTNLAFPFTEMSGDEPEEDVEQFWLSIIRLR